MPKISKKDVKVIQDDSKLIAPEVLALSILRISEAMKRFNQSRLNRYALIALIHDWSKVAKRDIEIVLNNLDNLEKNFLKPLK